MLLCLYCIIKTLYLNFVKHRKFRVILFHFFREDVKSSYDYFCLRFFHFLFSILTIRFSQDIRHKIASLNKNDKNVAYGYGAV